MSYLVTVFDPKTSPRDQDLWVFSPGGIMHSDQDEVEKRGVRILSDPFQNGASITRAYEEIWELTESLIEWLVPSLNSIHHVDHSVRYWRTHVGFWALLFVTVIYDRYQRLLRAKSEIPDVQFVGNANISPDVPSDTLSFANMAAENGYNQQLYQLLCKEMSISVEKSSESSLQKLCVSESGTVRKPRGGWRALLLPVFESVCSSALFSSNAHVLMVQSYLPKGAEVRLALMSMGKVLPYYPDTVWKGTKSNSPVDWEARAFLCEGRGGDDEGLMAILMRLSSVCMPKVFIEDYGALCRQSAACYRGLRPKVIYSANSFWFDETFKHWAADCQRQGSTLVIGEHGTEYFFRKHDNYERFEVSLSDYYLTWGWSSSKNRKLLPAPANKLVNLCRRKKVTGNGILYISTISARHSVLMLSEFSRYLEWQRRFFQCLPGDLHEEVIFRAHREDYGWKVENRIAETAPGVRMDSWDVSLHCRLQQCRLCVIDNMRTTFGEAIGANVPTVLFWDADQFPVMDGARPYYDLLTANHVIHDSPESAAEWVDKIYNSLDAWWFGEDCQNAVNKFCNAFARKSKRPINEWLKMLGGLSGQLR